MDKRVTPLKRVTSPTWGPPPPCKQALNTQVAHVKSIGNENVTLTVKSRCFKVIAFNASCSIRQMLAIFYEVEF